jgi:hypothetical protein
VLALVAAAGVEQRADLVNALQRTSGNKRVTRMIDRSLAPAGPLRRPLLQRYEAGEHAKFGARQGEIEERTTINNVDMSYGEMIAMGDLFESPKDMRKAPKKELRRCSNSSGASATRHR